MRVFLEPGQLGKCVSAASKVLERYKDKYDTLAFAGISGAIIAPPLALKMGKELIAVRKASDKCHSSYRVEGYDDVNNYIIVDDFIDTGATVRRIQEQIYHHFSEHAKCLGVLSVQDLAGTGLGETRTGLIRSYNLSRKQLADSSI
jgi:adenine/guanine phosphoribosyltransferase-like PRPP-binding protein